MEPNAYLTFLVLGVILVAIDGQIIYWSGRRYLEESFGDPAAGTSMTRLVAVLFHLVVLGLLMLISTLDLGGSNGIEAVVLRLGVVLLLLAVAHAATLGVLARIRDRQEQEKLTKATAERRRATTSGHQDAVITTPPARTAADPELKPPRSA